MGRPPRDRTEEGRSKRIPLGRARYKLKAEHLIPAGKKGRWINDDPGRLEDALEAGYTFVRDSDAVIGEGAENERDRLTTSVRRRVGVRQGGQAKMAYLMVIDKELWEEDQKDKEQDRMEIEEGLRRGNVQGGLAVTEGRYIPAEGTRIDHNIVVRRRSNE